MGFYGQIRYQFDKIFKSFKIKNSGKEERTFIEEIPEDKELTPYQLRQVLNIDSGNKWISLDGDQDKSEIKIYHSKGVSGSAIGFNKEEELPEGEQGTRLEYGNSFSTSVITLDEAGHVAGLKKQYFYLPESLLESQLADRVDSLESFTGEFEEKLNSPEEVDNRLKNLEEFKTGQENTFVSKTDYDRYTNTTDGRLGYIEQNVVYGTKSDIVGENFSFDDVTKAIGPLDEFSGQEGVINQIVGKTLNEESAVEDEHNYSFANSIKILGETALSNFEEVNNLKSTVSNSQRLIDTLYFEIDGLKKDIADLQKQISDLEGNSNITE